VCEITRTLGDKAEVCAKEANWELTTTWESSCVQPHARPAPESAEPHKNKRWSYSVRSASAGDIKLARKAGTDAATKADSPSVRTASKITTGLYGLSP
jgi:hypothetical protein